MTLKHFLFGVALTTNTIFIAQEYKGTYYEVPGHKAVYFPLGKISFADSIVSYFRGLPKPLQIYQNSSMALGPPDYEKFNEVSFVSLGCGGQLIVKFTENGFMNLPGDDLYIYEVGPSQESVRVEISSDGNKWIPAGVAHGGESSIDLSDYEIDSQTVFYYVKLIDLEDVCGGNSAGADIDAIGAMNSVVQLTLASEIFFDVAKFDIRKEAQAELHALLDHIKKFESLSIRIDGHTDSDGREAYNLELSKNRSHAIRSYLLKHLDPKFYTLEPRWFGKNHPRKPNTSARNKQENRRVEITLMPPKDHASFKPTE